MAATPPKLRYAPFACVSCRSGKRRCDRRIPACRLCDRRRLPCTYPAGRGVVVATDDGLSSQHEEERHSAQHTLHAPAPRPRPRPPPTQSQRAAESYVGIATAIRFIAPGIADDGGACKMGGGDGAGSPEIEIPDEVAALVGTPDDIVRVASNFFSATARWMPIICKKRFYVDVLNPLSRHRQALMLLALTMKLFFLPVPQEAPDGRSAVYRLVKRFHAELEASGDLSIHVLQAAVFIAIYEMEQAIYPSAYLSVGACARYGIAMGLNKALKRKGDGHPLGRSVLDLEQQRRVWWAILILDRFLNLGNPGRALATEDPAFSDFLPVDDERFHHDTFFEDDVGTISAGFSLQMGILSRLAQSTYLLTQVLNLMSSPTSSTKTDGEIGIVQDTAQLRRTILSLTHMANAEADSRQQVYCSPSATCFTSILLLQEYYWREVGAVTGEQIHQHVFPETQAVLDSVYGMVAGPMIEYAKRMSFDGPGKFSPPLLHMVYLATSHFITMELGKPDAETSVKIATLISFLEYMKGRSHVSTIFLHILAARKAEVIALACC